ncbi:MAG: PAS domain S-box protein [Prolixibacteraceae bacterium]|jgi:PAS domain S-box-containing protein|nr:PAS domain S-box protein [Prolixibacteraceae bacterium]MBT6005597.1 PAS domain S-box protein [Prolixibacteraceae bacterium]MBT6763559.1 PAS domain S-box protein [Prolixibacteraceae bacterium]MBT6998277.1 PAS domain S-box protein [Prolixibacteraceae bacterium]MBT7396477.1 PAS domain S-box protein [Prolixibacteraceae bacterium]
MNKNKTIVIAEDSATQAAHLQFILEDYGYTVFHGNDGRKALEIVSSKKPDLVISDIMMPEMDGYELTKHIKNDPQLKHIPVVLLTTLSSLADILKGLETGAENYIIKPYEEEDLIFKINSVLQKDGKKVTDLKGDRLSITYDNCDYLVDPGSTKLADFLITTYENVLRKNKIVEEKQNELRILNESLEEKIQERTAKLTAEIEVRKKVQEELGESEKKYRLLTETLLDSIFVIDADFRFVFVNLPAAKVLRSRPSEIIGKKIIDVIKGDADEYQIEAIENVFLTNETENTISKISFPRGDTWFDTQLIPIVDKSGKPYRVLGIARDITEKKQTEIEHQTIIQTSQDGFWIVDAGTGDLLDVNSAYCSIIGYSREELLKMKVQDVEALESPEETKKHFENVFETGHDLFETKHKKKSGEIIDIEVSVNLDIVGKNRFYVFLRDITERKQAEKALHESNEKFSVLYNNSPDMFVSVSPLDATILLCNDTLLEKTGYTRMEIIGMPIFKMYHENSLEDAKKAFQQFVETGEVNDKELVIKRKDGSKLEVSLNVDVVRNEAGGILYSISSWRDITERKLADKAQHEAENNLRKLSLELQERNSDLESYAHTVAHDLKNPVGVISGFAEIISEEDNLTSEETKEYSQHIYKSSLNLVNIINELLLFASLQKTEIDLKELDMKEIVSLAIDRVIPEKEQGMIDITLPDSWLTSVGHAPWIEEVWKNYISNAFKYGGVPLKIEFGCEQNKSETHPNFVKYWIKDFGPGISEKNQKLLFKKFERLDQVKATGHGLGLSIVRRIVEKLGGKTGVESEPGKGSTFYFMLPYKCPDKNEVSKAPSINKLLSHKTLIVEDDMASDIYLGVLAKNFSNEVIHVPSGNEAVKACLNNPGIDLVLMDISLPDITGYEATRRIRESNKNVIIIVQTAYTLSNTREKAIEAGCNAYISKPIRPDLLSDIIEEQLKNRATP